MDLIKRIKGRDARVGIIGQGYVGLPLALLFSEAGFPVTAFDVDTKKVDALNAGRSYIAHVGADRVAAAVARPVPLRATTDFAELADCDAILVCLPTPLGKHREPDLSYILGAARTIAEHLTRRPAGGPGIDHVPGHHRRGSPADPRGHRPQDARRLLAGLLARARGSGEPDASTPAIRPRS